MALDDLGCLALPAASRPIRILQLTDLHLFPLRASAWQARGRLIPLDGRYSVTSSLKLAHAIANRVSPDLVVLTGDILDGRPFGRDGEPGSWREPFEALVEPLVAQGCQWTFVPGNHDDDASPWGRDALLEVLTLPGCASRGASRWDHTFTVQRRGAANATRLFFLDSGGNDDVHKYGTVDKASVAASAELLRGARAAGETALFFFHIPPPEAAGLVPIAGTAGLFDAALASGVVPRPWRWVPWLVRLWGLDRVVGASKLNSGLVAAITKSAARVAAFFGHDHHNDCVYEREGVVLAYGRTGSCTPPSDWEGTAPLPFSPGARVIDVGDDGEVVTWIETASGEEAGSRLNLFHAASTTVSVTA